MSAHPRTRGDRYVQKKALKGADCPDALNRYKGDYAPRPRPHDAIDIRFDDDSPAPAASGRPSHAMRYVDGLGLFRKGCFVAV